MSDEIDAAQERDQRLRDQAIAAARVSAAGEGSEDCEDCGAPIDLRRRFAVPNTRRCLCCQEVSERARRRVRGV